MLIASRHVATLAVPADNAGSPIPSVSHGASASEQAPPSLEGEAMTAGDGNNRGQKT